MDKHADRYYEEIRQRTSDVKVIAQNSGFSEGDITNIKEHIFIKEHELDVGKPLRRFFEDYDIAISWQRLIEGKAIREMDMVLLNHELLELNLMSEGLSYDEAHALAESKYNYKKYIDDLNEEEGMI